MIPEAKIAKILRTKESIIKDLGIKLEAHTGKGGVMSTIVKENDFKVGRALKILNLKKNSKAEEVYNALVDRVRHEDEVLAEMLGHPHFSTTAGCEVLINSVKDNAGDIKGFFLKKEKAEELLRANPPGQIIRLLGYKDIDELLEKEDMIDVFCALRFAENPHWLNDVFFREYQSIGRDDFEYRSIDVRVLGEKWLEIGEKFVGKKLHHISHLKELGVIFVIPFNKNYPGATLEVYSLLLHYIHEVDFYSRLFTTYSLEDNFTGRMISALKGEVGGLPLPDQEMLSFRIVQRYLAKDDPNDPRLFEPHVNPEVIHWLRGEDDLARLGIKFKELDIEIFDDLDSVGEFFDSEKLGKKVLISFDLIDNIISLTKQSDIESKYLYHQHEAMWNKIFVEYLGFRRLERLILDNLEKGYIIYSTKLK